MASARDVNPEPKGSELYNGDLHIDEFSSFSTAIVKAIAAVKNVEPSEVDVRLYDHVNPDALDALYQHADRTNSPWELEFSITDLHITVRSTGEVKLEQITENTQDPPHNESASPDAPS